jgi:hypothetical protein
MDTVDTDDIIFALDAALQRKPIRPGTASCDVNVFLRQIPANVLEEAIAEIKNLRAMLGAARLGDTFSDITKNLSRCPAHSDPA